jgi:acylphosphatase
MITRVVVRGRVQGVSFRAWMMRRATAAGIDGWVRNREDGGVEAVLAGAPEAIEELIDSCRTGPDLALVTDVIALPHDEEPGQGFRIRA